MDNIIKVKKDMKAKCWLGYWIDGFLGDQWVPLPFTLNAPFSLVLDTLSKTNPDHQVIRG